MGLIKTMDTSWKKSTPRRSKQYPISFYIPSLINFISCLDLCPSIIQPSASLSPLGRARRETRSKCELKLKGSQIPLQKIVNTIL